MLGAVVVGEPVQAEPLEHLRALLRAALFRIEGDDAPSDEIRGREDIGVRLRGARRRGEAGREQEGEEQEGGAS